MADTEDLSCLKKLSASEGNADVDGVKVGEPLAAFAEWQRRAKAGLSGKKPAKYRDETAPS